MKYVFEQVWGQVRILVVSQVREQVREQVGVQVQRKILNLRWYVREQVYDQLEQEGMR